MVGLVATVNNWDTVLSDIIPPSSSKLRVIIKTEREEWSYDLVDGVAKFLQVGAIFNQNHAYMGHYFSLPVFKGEVTYSISVYPTLDLIDDFMTKSPVINCSISVSVIMLTCIIFITYDGVVQREVEKKERAKLNFVRFISHEMRTPLNT
jgi:signal transduction histidine kinase